MEEQFILRVPPSVAQQIERLLDENPSSSSEDQSLDLSFSEDGRSGTFMIGDEQFPASLLDLPTVVESYKTHDDATLVKTADIGQIIMVRENNDIPPDMVEYRHGLTPPMKDARRRRFRREPDVNPEVVERVDQQLWNIIQNGTADAAANEGDENASNASKKPAPPPKPMPDTPANNTGEADRSSSDESDESV